MAVLKVPVGTSLRMQFQTGTDVDGDPIFRSRSLSNVKHAADDEDVLAVANGLAELQRHPLVMVIRTDQARLEED